MHANTKAPWEIFLALTPLNIQCFNTDVSQRKGIQASVLAVFFPFVNSFSFHSFSSVPFSPSFLPHFFGLFFNCEGQNLEFKNRQLKALQLSIQVMICLINYHRDCYREGRLQEEGDKVRMQVGSFALS